MNRVFCHAQRQADFFFAFAAQEFSQDLRVPPTQSAVVPRHEALLSFAVSFRGVLPHGQPAQMSARCLSAVTGRVKENLVVKETLAIRAEPESYLRSHRRLRDEVQNVHNL